MSKTGNAKLELARADEAVARLVDCLRRLEVSLASEAQGPAPRGRSMNHRTALQALQRHASIALAEFAYVDGERVRHPHPALLTAFYPDPSDVVASRYCWALLGEAPGNPPPLSRLIAATLKEKEAFHQAQEPRAAPHAGTVAGEMMRLLAEEDSARTRADRLAYTLAVLQRLHLVARHETTQHSQLLRELDHEMARLTEATLKAGRDLRQAQLKRIAAARRGR